MKVADRHARRHPAHQELTTEDRQAAALRMCHQSLPLGLVLNTNPAAGLSNVNNVCGSHT
jgi:hypothetical protein